MENLNNKKHQFPDAICNMISENSCGAWLLFRVDEFGQVQMHGDIDSEILEDGLIVKALSILNNIVTLKNMNTFQDLSGDNGDEEE